MPEPTPQSQLSNTSTADDPELQAMQAQVEQWEAYVREQQQKRTEAAALVQEAVDASGLSAKGIHPSDPVFAALSEDLEFRRQVSLHYGLKLDQAEPIDTSKPDVSRWRQKTRALKV